MQFLFDLPQIITGTSIFLFQNISAHPPFFILELKPYNLCLLLDTFKM